MTQCVTCRPYFKRGDQQFCGVHDGKRLCFDVCLSRFVSELVQKRAKCGVHKSEVWIPRHGKCGVHNTKSVESMKWEKTV